jgi:UPF0755 protein
MARISVTRILVATVFIVMLGTAGVAAWLWNDYRQFVSEPINLPERGTEYRVRAGATLRQVAAELAGRGILREPLYLRLLGRERGDADRIKAGDYALVHGMTPDDVIDLFVSGAVIEYSLTLVEGWTFRQALEAVRRHERIVHTLDAAITDGEVMAGIGAPGVHPEGRFFPDTYLFPGGTTDVDFLRRAYERMSDILAGEWAARSEDLPLESAEDALILASIVEKETGLPQERAEVAGVFVRRLRKGMLLQTDPTVIYGMGASFDGNIRRRDLKKDTPYNTYTRSGLTPTPICLPGRDAIHAALHPADGDALYFVATGDGGHKFSATLAEHNRAVRRYQLKRKEQ